MFHTTRSSPASDQLCAEHVASCALLQVLLLRKATKILALPGHACCVAIGHKVSPEIALWLTLAGYAWESKGEPISVRLADESYLLPAEMVIYSNPDLRFHICFEPFAIFSYEELINHSVKLIWQVLESYQSTVIELANLVRQEKMVGRRKIICVVNSHTPPLSCKPWSPEVIDLVNRAKMAARRQRRCP